MTLFYGERLNEVSKIALVMMINKWLSINLVKFMRMHRLEVKVFNMP